MELTSLETIAKLVKVVKKENVIKNIYMYRFFNDEPKFYSFTAQLYNGSKHFLEQKFSGGCSFYKENALIKTLGEAVERHFLSLYDEKNFIWSNYAKLKKRAINPNEFISFSESKTKSGLRFYKNSEQKLNWINALSIIHKKNILIPAQLIYVPYKLKVNEPVINFSISTGASFHVSLNNAILNGLLEVIERDAFMISYLNKLARNIIDVSNAKNQVLNKIVASVKKYNLELYVLDVSTDVPVYSIMCIIIDRTNLGPAVSLGIKSDLDLNKAIIGAIEECVHGRSWIREVLLKTKKAEIKEINSRKYHINSIKERGILWSDYCMIDKINFFLSGKKVSIESLLKQKVNNLDSLLKWFEKEKIKTFYVDLTSQSLKKHKVYVVKVVVPQLQPLYLDERFPCWEGNRLKEVPRKLNFKALENVYKFPHPFL